MSISKFNPIKLIALSKSEKYHFSKEQQEAADSILQNLNTAVLSLQDNITLILSHPVTTLMDKYNVIASSLISIQISDYYFRLCQLEIGGSYKEHTKQSMEIYTMGRRFFHLAVNLLQEIFVDSKEADYLEISNRSAELVEFNYSRKLIFFQNLIEAVTRLFLFQKGTNFLILNWDLRLESFFLARNSINYSDLLDRKLTDPFFNEKDEIIRMLILSYEVIITDLKRDYELTKQDFFAKNVILLLEEYKKFNVLLRDLEKAEWLGKQINTWQRIRRKRI